MSKIVYSIMIILFSFSAYGKWQEASYQNTTIYNYIPNNNGLQKRALMVSLHGCRQDSKNMRDHANWESTAEEWNMMITVPQATDGGVFVGCWDYFGRSQGMDKPDVNYLVTWIEKLLKDPKLNIDKHQVYISGFSSGATMAMVIGCVRPDLISGIASNSGPAIGTKYYQSEYIATDAPTAAKLCKKWAGKNAEYLETQTSAIVNGNFDIIVSPGYNRLNAKFYGILTGSDLQPSGMDLKSLHGNNTKGEGTQWSDQWSIRVTHIVNKSLGHNWPAGVGKKRQGQVSGNSINFPRFLGEYFYKNNRRRR